jgi:hypothetical protein
VDHRRIIIATRATPRRGGRLRRAAASFNSALHRTWPRKLLGAESVTLLMRVHAAEPWSVERRHMRGIIALALLLLAGCQTVRVRIDYILARDTSRVRIVEQGKTAACVQVGTVSASDGHSCSDCNVTSFGSKARAMRRLKQKVLLRHGNALVIDPIEEVRTTSHSEGEEIVVRGTALRCGANVSAIATSPGFNSELQR